MTMPIPPAVAAHAATIHEHLTTGWEPDTPIGDTLLRRHVFNLADSWRAPIAAHGGRVTRCETFAAADLGRPAAYWNAATLLQPLPPGDPDRTEAVLSAIDAFFADGSGDVLLWSAWPTPDLRRRGWRLEGFPPLLVRAPGPPPRADTPPGLRIDRVVDSAGIRDFERVAVDGYPFTDLQPLVPGSLFDERLLADERLRLEVGYEDDGSARGRAVTIGALYTAHGVAHLMLGVTLPQARHRGYWAAMARSRLQASPGVPATGLFSDMSRPGAERLFGFMPITRFTLWTRPRH